MKNFILLLNFILPLVMTAKTIIVEPHGEYSSISEASHEALPGDTILVKNGNYYDGNYIEELQGEPDNYITIRAENAGEVVFKGGSNAMHLIDPAFLRIEGLHFEGQSANGVNIDDGGSYDTPAHDLVISNCVWRVMGADGNNDELKLSGVKDFVIQNCTFKHGASGGSLIDMVGCHNGFIEKCRFENGGSNSIQIKGGSSGITVRQNEFRDGGLRAVNIGGSTGSEFFRPLDANAEASDILVYSNLFFGGQTPFAFVGAVLSAAVNNTIIMPEKWAFRILQENNLPEMQKCSHNEVINNIFYFDGNISFSEINTGPNTKPETFKFSKNLWYKENSTQWEGPNLPSEENNGLTGYYPEFKNYPGDLRLKSLSPAIGAGVHYDDVLRDHTGNKFKETRSIGAYEFYITDGINNDLQNYKINIFPNPANDQITITSNEKIKLVEIVSLSGITVKTLDSKELRSNKNSGVQLSLEDINAGVYIMVINREYTGKLVVE